MTATALLLQAAALTGGAFAAGGNLDHFDVTVAGTPTAGAALNLTLTAKDAMNRPVRNYEGVKCLVFSDTAPNSPSGAGPSYPGQGLCATGQSSVSFSGGSASPAVTVYYAGSHTLSVSDPSIPFSGSSGAFTVAAGSAAALTFSAQPIDTEVNTPIYSQCVPDPDGVTPCATTTESPASSPVVVHEVDAWGNFSTNAVTIKNGTTTLKTLSPNAVGDVSFGEFLSIATTGTSTLRASTSSTVYVDGNPIQIVNDLKACDSTACANVANNGQRNIQRAVNTIATTGDFFAGTTNVVLATQFLSGSVFTDKCSSTPIIGQGTEAKLDGTIGNTSPTTTMLLIMPKKSLQAFGISSRSAASFNVCVGATWIDTSSTATPWTTENPATGGLVSGGATLSEGQYWGLAADCSALPANASDPCAALKTKNLGDVVAYYQGIGDSTTAALIPTLMQSSDLAIIVREGFPWDGKTGLY